MKILLAPIAFTFLFVTLWLGGSAQQAPLPAEQILKEATAKAAKEKKNVFIIFHASWCGWCHRMDTAMNDASVKDAFNKNYVIRHITVLESADKKSSENPGGMDLLARYNGHTEGIPYWLVFNPSGKLLADSRMKNDAGELHNIGCPAQPEEISGFLAILKNTSRMSDAELEAVKERFGKINARH